MINKRKDVTPDTRERVEAAIRELGYQPNAIARSMAHGQTNTLACIAPNLTDYTFASIIEGAEQEARPRGFFLLSSSAGDAKSFRSLVDELVGHRRVDGLMVINPYVHRYDSASIPASFPTVYVGTREEGINSVSLDDEGVAYEATRHLFDLGHRSISMVTGPLEEYCSRNRDAGYRRALEEVGCRRRRLVCLLRAGWVFASYGAGTATHCGLCPERPHGFRGLARRA